MLGGARNAGRDRAQGTGRRAHGAGQGRARGAVGVAVEFEAGLHPVLGVEGVSGGGAFGVGGAGGGGAHGVEGGGSGGAHGVEGGVGGRLVYAWSSVPRAQVVLGVVAPSTGCAPGAFGCGHKQRPVSAAAAHRRSSLSAGAAHMVALPA